MPDNSPSVAAERRGKPSASLAHRVKGALNVFLAAFLLSSVIADRNRQSDMKLEMAIFIVSVAVAPIVWLLLTQGVVRRRALSVRFLLGLLIAGAFVNGALHADDRRVVVFTALSLIGPAIALLVAHRAVRSNVEELAERRHRELVEAAERAASQGSEALSQRRSGSVRSRARRSR